MQAVRLLTVGSLGPLQPEARLMRGPLDAALATWGKVTFDYASTDTPDAVPTPLAV